MDFHLERGLRLSSEREHKGLYSWAINEIDKNGDPIGRDQIPWGCTLYFSAISCAFSDSIELEEERQLDETDTPSEIKILQSQVIRVKLRPGHPKDEGDYSRDTKYSMFGTARNIQDFQLDIHPIVDGSRIESCSAWGSSRYTYDADFRDETNDDCIVFRLFVNPDRFVKMAAKISNRLVDEIILSVASVDGFYSEWSPEISTRSVKVLTRGEEHELVLSENIGIDPPKAGLSSRSSTVSQPSP